MRQAASDNNENRKKRRWQLATAAFWRGSAGGRGGDRKGFLSTGRGGGWLQIPE